ncbi:hypothetical protein [Novosphingobium taihuense]|uniref:hypothetical protein n=1 Tax=Novosphingobium taihuense TaxID=260085 RepID=UPI00215CCB2A|nr:hypothetical protein [Novosphingobium taihuense]
MAIQLRLRDTIEIIDRAIPWAGSELAAYAWYRSKSLRSLGDAAAEELVRLGHGEKVRANLGRIAVGGFA